MLDIQVLVEVSQRKLPFLIWQAASGLSGSGLVAVVTALPQSYNKPSSQIILELLEPSARIAPL